MQLLQNSPNLQGAKMTLHDTFPIELKDTSHLVRLLNVLVSEESKATEQYEQVLEALGDEYTDVKEALNEIKTDELNHLGILLNLISKLDPAAAEAMLEGINEGK